MSWASTVSTSRRHGVVVVQGGKSSWGLWLGRQVLVLGVDGRALRAAEAAFIIMHPCTTSLLFLLHYCIRIPYVLI